MRSGGIFVELGGSYGSVEAGITEGLKYVIPRATFSFNLISIQISIRPLHQLKLIILLILTKQISHLLIVNFNNAYADVIFVTTLVKLHVAVKFVY